MKLFQMDDYEFWIAPDLTAAKAAYIEAYGDDCADDLDDAGEVSEAALDTMKVDHSENGDGSGPMLTARETLAQEIAAGGTFPRMAFAIDW